MSLNEADLVQYTTVGTKDPLIVPAGYLRYSVTLVPNSSVAKIQHTVGPKSVVEADPSLVEWVDWPDGPVSTPTEADLVGAATAIRVVVLTGADVKLWRSFTVG